MTLLKNDRRSDTRLQTRIVFIGDSIVHGVGDNANLGGWPGRLLRAEQRLEMAFTFYNLGIRSDTSDDIAKRWLSESTARLPPSIPSIYVFSFGLNDATSINDDVRVPLERSLENARMMLNAAKSRARVLWIGPTPIDETSQPVTTSIGTMQTKSNTVTHAYNEGYKILADELQIPYLDLFTHFNEQTAWEEFLFDGVHPNASGYDAIASLVQQWDEWRASFATLESA